MKNKTKRFFHLLKKFFILIVINEIANWATPIDRLRGRVCVFPSNNSIKLFFSGYTIHLDEMTASFPLSMYQRYLKEKSVKQITEKSFYTLLGTFKFNRDLCDVIIVVCANEGKMHMIQHYLGRGFVLTSSDRREILDFVYLKKRSPNSYANKIYFPSLKEQLIQ